MALQPSELKRTRGRRVAQAGVNGLQDKILGIIPMRLLQQVAFASGPNDDVRASSRIRARKELKRRQGE